MKICRSFPHSPAVSRSWTQTAWSKRTNMFSSANRRWTAKAISHPAACLYETHQDSLWEGGLCIKWLISVRTNDVTTTMWTLVIKLSSLMRFNCMILCVLLWKKTAEITDFLKWYEISIMGTNVEGGCSNVIIFWNRNLLKENQSLNFEQV